jgi:hypothetical protein
MHASALPSPALRAAPRRPARDARERAAAAALRRGQARHSYTASDIVWEHAFAPCAFPNHDRAPLPRPEARAAQGWAAHGGPPWRASSIIGSHNLPPL